MSEVTCYLALGSNIETDSSTRYDFLAGAVRQLAQHQSIHVSSASHVYETTPVGFADQTDFYNVVVQIETSLNVHELLKFCLDIMEKRAGRIRTTKDGPRTLDVDILLYGDEKVDTDDLVIPHPKMDERAFVILPLKEIAPDKVRELSSYKFVDDTKGVRKTDLEFSSIISSYKDS